MEKIRSFRKKTGVFITKRPLATFLISLGILLFLIVVGNILRRPAPQPPVKPAPPKRIDAYRVGDSPRVAVQASVEKTGVITITAQTPGIVQNVYPQEGDTVSQGETIAWISATYQGGNPASVSRELAQRNASFQNDTYDIQKDLVNKQRDVAQKQGVQSADLREISRRSLDETRNLLNVNSDIVSSVDRQIGTLRDNNANGSNDATIQQLEQSKIAAQASLAQARAQLQQTDYQTNEASPPAQLSVASRDLTLRQLDLQDKSVDLQRDVANLNAKLARISELLYYPAAPFAGTVERIYVTPGDSVSPGTKIATIRAEKNEIVATALVDQQTASKYARAETSIVRFPDGTSANIAASYVPDEATDGTLSAIRFDIPQEYSGRVVNTGYITIEMPLGGGAVIGSDVFVPLDSIYQTQNSSYVFVARKNKKGAYIATTQEVMLGGVSGSFVRVKSGVGSGDTIIVSRSIQEGDAVQF